jgi:pilus assembly protein Flp/PilA
VALGVRLNHASPGFLFCAAWWILGREEQSMTPLWRFLQDESGPTAVEYAVMLALIIGTCVAAITTFGTEAGGSLHDTSTKLDTYMNN